MATWAVSTVLQAMRCPYLLPHCSVINPSDSRDGLVDDTKEAEVPWVIALPSFENVVAGDSRLGTRQSPQGQCPCKEAIVLEVPPVSAVDIPHAKSGTAGVTRVDPGDPCRRGGKAAPVHDVTNPSRLSLGLITEQWGKR